MRNCFRVSIGLIAVWALFLGALTVWPDAPRAAAPGGLAMNFFGPSQPVRQAPPARYAHTGLWVADVRADGTVVYLREIRRR